MGLNMPAKTGRLHDPSASFAYCLLLVVFTSCRKFDGSEFRLVSPGEIRLLQDTFQDRNLLLSP